MDTFFKVFLVISIVVQAYAAPRLPRLSLAEYEGPHYYYHNNIDGDPQMYSFGYDVSDPVTGNTQYRSEERHPNGTVTGSYGYVDAYGAPQKFKYIADSLGYRVYPDITTRRPFAVAFAGNEPTQSSITWTRPPKTYKNKVITDLVAQLGTLFTKTNLI